MAPAGRLRGDHPCTICGAMTNEVYCVKCNGTNMYVKACCQSHAEKRVGVKREDKK